MRCSSCGLKKAAEAFAWRKIGISRQSKCRRCQRNYAKTHYKKNKALYVERAKRSNVLLRKRLLKIIIEERTRPCLDCKLTFPWHVMDFDHVRGKKIANVGRMARQTVTEQKLRAEIAKCDVVCANCHRLRTYSRTSHARVAEILVDAPGSNPGG